MSNIVNPSPSGITTGTTVITGGTNTRVLFDNSGTVGETTGITTDGAAVTIKDVVALGLRDASAAFDVTLAAVSSVALTAGRTLTLDMGNVAHTLALGTTANTITFPNAASGTVPLLNLAQSFTAQQTFAAGTITTSQPLTLTQTWNAAGVTFNGLLVNNTLTAQANGSLYADFQRAGTSKFRLDANANDYFGAGSAVLFLSNGGGANDPFMQGLTLNGAQCFLMGAGNANALVLSTAGIATRTIGYFAWNSGAFSSLTPDTFLTRRGAANVQFGNADTSAPVAQTVSVQSVIAGTSNTAGADRTETGSIGTGTGAGGKFIFQTAPAGASGTAQNSLATALTLTSPAVNMQPSVVVGNQALATNATDGFLYITTCAGTPTGTPTAFTGRVAMVFDTTNKKFYIYSGSWLGGTSPGAFT